MKRMWIIFAILSAVFAAATSVLAKVGIEHVDSNLATAIRTFVVLVMAWLMALADMTMYESQLPHTMYIGEIVKVLTK